MIDRCVILHNEICPIIGTAVITATHAALWTRGKYFLQAETQLGCDWILMRESKLLLSKQYFIWTCPLLFPRSQYKDV
jgi:hypothetical protein